MAVKELTMEELMDVDYATRYITTYIVPKCREQVLPINEDL